MVEIMGEARRSNSNLGVPVGMHPSFTSPAETFRIRYVDISVTPNKSMNYYTQYLLLGQVLTAGTAGKLAMFFE